MSLHTYFKKFNEEIKMDYKERSELKDKRYVLLSPQFAFYLGKSRVV